MPLLPLSLSSTSSITQHAVSSPLSTLLPNRSSWCLFHVSVLKQRPIGTNHAHRDSYSHFATDSKGVDNTCLGWNDFMRMSEFLEHEAGYLVDDTAMFNTSFHAIKESSSFFKNPRLMLGGRAAARKLDGHFDKFTWRIENSIRLKGLLKKRKITGLCVKSRRFQIGNQDCRLIVYPRGQSKLPCHLSVFLEVADSRSTTSDWSCFVSHQLSVVNQKMEEKSLTKESQNRYSKAAKDGAGRVGKMLYSRHGKKFDYDLKQLRFAGDLLMELGAGLELATPALPHLFLPLACMASVAKNVGAVTSPSTRTPIYKAYAKGENIGDVTAKGECVGNIVDLLGTGLSILVSKSNPSLVASFAFLSCGYVLSSYQEVKSVVLHTTNRARFAVVVNSFLKIWSIPSLKEGNAKENIFSFPWSKQTSVVLGARFGEHFKSHRHFLP